MKHIECIENILTEYFKWIRGFDYKEISCGDMLLKTISSLDKAMHIVYVCYTDKFMSFK